MVWIKLSESKPKKGQYVITRGSSYSGGDLFESHRIWMPESYLNITPPLTHWWSGEPDFDLSVKEWRKNEKY